MLTDIQTAIERPQAVFKNGCRLTRDGRLRVSLELARLQEFLFEEGNDFVEHRSISGYLDVERGDKRQPQQIVGDRRPHTASGWRMPPVLHVAFLKLMR